MATIEIDENELANWRNLQPVLAAIEKHPEARALAQKAAALAAPERASPEVKLREEFTGSISEIKDMLAKDREEREKEKAERDAASKTAEMQQQWTAGRAKLRSQGFNQEGIDAIEKLMEERGVADHEVAAAYFERLNPPPEPLMTGGNRWDWSAPEVKNAPDLKPLFEGREDEFLGPAIANAIKEVRGLA